MAEKQVEKTCFVISPIGDEGSEVRKRSDQILKHVITPAITCCGFVPLRADKISEPGIITSQVIQHIIEDPLVIADLTGQNPNVFYELALRHAIRKPLIQVIEKDEKIPFDVAGMRTINIDHRDLDSVEESKNEIEKQIKNILKKKESEIESPVSVSIELQALRQSDNPEERSFAEFVSAVAELRSDINAIDKRLSNPETLLPRHYIMQMLSSIPKKAHPKEEILLLELEQRIRKIQMLSKSKNSEKLFSEIDALLHEMMYLRHSVS